MRARNCHEFHEALRDWVSDPDGTYYLLGSAVGPHPFPLIVRDFQSVIGREAREQCLSRLGRLPDAVVACVGGGSNAAGMFYPFVDDTDVQLFGVEAGGRSGQAGDHASPLTYGNPGILHGSFSYVMQDEDGQIRNTHSISAGLDYASVGPEHAYLRSIERAYYTYATDQETLDAFQMLSELEGIIPALESSHAVAEAIKLAPQMRADQRHRD